MEIFETRNEQETIAAAARLATSAKAGDVFLLDAPMGAGKSVFARGFIRALCGQDKDVPSPTFTLVQTYECDTAQLWHFDLYRLETPDEVLNIGWDDALSGDAICLIEWPQKAGEYLPPHAQHISIEITGENARRICVDDKQT